MEGVLVSNPSMSCRFMLTDWNNSYVKQLYPENCGDQLPTFKIYGKCPRDTDSDDDDDSDVIDAPDSIEFRFMRRGSRTTCVISDGTGYFAGHRAEITVYADESEYVDVMHRIFEILEGRRTGSHAYPSFLTKYSDYCNQKKLESYKQRVRVLEAERNNRELEIADFKAMVHNYKQHFEKHKDLCERKIRELELNYDMRINGLLLRISSGDDGERSVGGSSEPSTKFARVSD